MGRKVARETSVTGNEKGNKGARGYEKKKVNKREKEKLKTKVKKKVEEEL